MDSNSTILRAAAKFFSGTMISRVTGLMRDVSMAYAFGTSAPLAAFLTAFRLTNIPRRLLGEGGMQTAFIPQFESLKKENPQRALHFFRDLHAALSFFLGFLIVGVMGALYFSMSFFELDPGTTEVLWMTFLMMPSLFFICLYGLNSGLLECEGSYFTPSVAPIAFNIVWIISTLLLSGLAPEEAMTPLACAIVFAAFGQWAMTLPKTKKILQIPLLKEWSLFSTDLKSLMKPLFLANLGVVASQLNSGLDPLFARYAHPEGPAWLWYAIRIEQLPLGLFAIALSGALLPPLSRAAKSGDPEKFNQFLKYALTRSAWVMIPVTLSIFILGHWSVNLLFGRGDFGVESVNGTTLCLWGYAIGLLPQTWVLILAPAYYARGDYKTPAKGSAYSVVLNLCFNSLFVFWLHWGPESIAIATSLATIFNCTYLHLKLRKITNIEQEHGSTASFYQ